MDTTELKQTNKAPRLHPLIVGTAAVLATAGVLAAVALVGQQTGAEPDPGRAAATQPPAAGATRSPATPATRAATHVCADCGVVVAVRTVKVPGEGSGLGVVAGGVVGGVIGNQIGGGSGRDAARVVGAIGGAVAGHQIEKQARSSVHYQVDVRLDNGATRTVSTTAAPAVTVGDRVRLDGQGIRRA